MELSTGKKKKSKKSGPRARFLRNHGSSYNRFSLYALSVLSCVPVRVFNCVYRRRPSTGDSKVPVTATLFGAFPEAHAKGVFNINLVVEVPNTY